MDKEQVRTEIKDLSYRLRFHTEQADFHRGVAEKTLKMVKRREGQLVDTQLAEEQEPKFIKPKHLDYGTYCFGNTSPIEAVYIDMSHGLSDTALYLTESSWGALYASCALKHGGFMAIHGNLTDLAAISEPLKTMRYGHIMCEMRQDELVVSIGGKDYYVLPQDVSKFILDLQRLQYTAQRTQDDNQD